LRGGPILCRSTPHEKRPPVFPHRGRAFEPVLRSDMADSTRPPHGGKDARDDPPLACGPLPPLDEIREEHRRYVRSLLARWRVTPTHWREDIMQDVLREAHRSRGSPLGPALVLFIATKRSVARWRRCQRRTEETKATVEHTATRTARDPSDALRAAERRALVLAAIDDIAPLERDVFVRIQLDGCDMPEVAEELGIPLGTGHARLRRARRDFLAALMRQMARRRLKPEDL
jgi:RNA polymerase sigma factor (sigma-70 family)